MAILLNLVKSKVIISESVSSPSESGITWKRKLARREYCSTASVCASRVATFFSSSESRCSFVASCLVSNSTCADRWSSLSDNAWGNNVVFIFFRICSSHNSSVILSKIVSVSYILVSVETLLPERDLAAYGIVVLNVYSQSAGRVVVHYTPGGHCVIVDSPHSHLPPHRFDVHSHMTLHTTPISTKGTYPWNRRRGSAVRAIIHVAHAIRKTQRPITPQWIVEEELPSLPIVPRGYPTVSVADDNAITLPSQMRRSISTVLLIAWRVCYMATAELFSIPTNPYECWPVFSQDRTILQEFVPVCAI